MLNKYLDAIDIGVSVNFMAFLKQLPAKYGVWRSFFKLEKDGVGTKYFVTFINQDEQKNLRSIAFKKSNMDRLVATELGDSHKHKVSSNGFAVRSLLNNSYSLLVLGLDGSLFVPEIVSNHKCVIIENREVFYSKDLLLLLQLHGINGVECDVILGNGSEVKNKFLSEFLYHRYGDIHCLFDYDLGGIKMYRSLVKSLNGSQVNVEFSLPLDMSLCSRPDNCKKPDSTTFNLALKMALELGLLKLHSDLMSSSRFLEQEMLLVNLEE